jgi:hypothetical protein
MPVSLKNFNVGESGLEFEIRDTDTGKHRGDLIITDDGLEWCIGQTRRGNGIKVTWDKFISIVTNEHFSI